MPVLDVSQSSHPDHSGSANIAHASATLNTVHDRKSNRVLSLPCTVKVLHVMSEHVLEERIEVRMSKRDHNLLEQFATHNGCSISDVARKAIKLLLGQYSYLPDEEKRALGINGPAKKESASTIANESGGD